MTGTPANLCAYLLEHEEAQLRAHQRLSTLNPGQRLFEEGDACHESFILESGIMLLERLAADGGRQILAFVYPGDLIGLDVAGRHPCDATALTSSRVARISRQHFSALRKAHPAIDHALITVTKQIVGFTLNQIFMLGRLTARQRMAYLVLHLAQRSGLALVDGVIIDCPMTRQDMADFLGLTPETVSRALSALKRDGLVESPCRGRLALIDIAALTALARP